MTIVFCDGALNTDIKLWQKEPGNYYSPSIHVTASGAIGINVGGYVIVVPVEQWHSWGKMFLSFKDYSQWRRNLIYWLLKKPLPPSAQHAKLTYKYGCLKGTGAK